MKSLPDQTILVTGATGSLGRQLILELQARGVQPIAMVRASSDTSWLKARNVPIRTADLRNKEALHKALQGIDGVIHTAAWVSFRGDRFTQFTGINVFGAVELFRAAQANGVRRFIHVSSVAAIGALPRSGGEHCAPDVLLTEEHVWNLEHLRVPYILTKRAAEHELRVLATDGAPELVIVNPSIMLTEDLSLGRKRQIHRVLSRLILPDFGTRFNVVDIRDCAPAIVAALESGRPGERYILAGENITIRGLIRQLARGGRSPLLIRFPRFLLLLIARMAAFWTRVANRPRLRLYPDLVRLTAYDWVYSSARAEAELGFRSRPLARSLSDLLDSEFVDSR